MRPGTPVVYKDFSGYVTTPPALTPNDPNYVWVWTRDGMLVSLPLVTTDGRPTELREVSNLPKLTAEDEQTARAFNLLPKEPVVEPKLFLKAGFIRLAKGRNHPAGTYKILAGGLGEDREELQKAVWASGYKSQTHRLAVVSWNDGEGYFVIEVAK